MAFVSPSRTGRIWLLIVALGVGLYALLGFLIAPPIARSYLTKTLGEVLHREVSLRRIRINPFVLSVTADGFLIRDTDGAALLSWNQLYLNFQLLSLVQRDWTFREIRLVDFSGRLVIRKDGTLNISDIVQSLTTPADTQSPPSETPLIHVGHLRIHDARLEFVDLTRPARFQTVLGPLRIDLREFGTHHDSKNPYSFAGRTESGESFSWKGFFYLDPIRSGGEFTLGDIELTKYRPYYQENVGFDVKGGKADLSSSYELEWGPQRRTARLAGAHLMVSGLKISERGLEELAVDVPIVELNQVNVDALTGETRLASVVTRDGSLILRQYADGSNNLRRMIEPLLAGEPITPHTAGQTSPRSGAPPAPAPPSPVSGPNILISEVRFADFKVLAEDLVPSRPVTVHFDQVNMVMHNVDNRPETTSTGTVGLRWEEGGTVTLAGDLSIFKLQGNLDAKFDSIDITPLDPYLEATADLRVTSGKLSAAGKVKVNLLDPEHPEFSYLGSLRLEDFISVDGAKRGDFLKCKRLEAASVDYSLDPSHLHLGEVLAQDLVGRISVEPDGTNNLFTVLRMAPATGTAAAATTAPPAASGAAPSADHGETTIRRVRLKGGKLVFEDHTLQPAVRLSLARINGTLSGLSSKELSRADLSLEAQVENVAPVKLFGKINPLSDKQYSDVTLETRGVDLTPLGPYSGKYLGYAFKKGKVTLDMKYLVNQRTLQASNVITIDQLLLGEKVESPDATKLPVKLGVALLKDRNGVIKLDVPVEGNLDDPEFRLGRVILRAMGVVFTKIITSPFTLLARAFGGSEEDLSYLEYEPGSDDLMNAAQEKLNVLVTSLYERPALTAEIRGSVDEAADRDGLKRRKLESLLRREKWSSMSKKERAATTPEAVTLTEGESPSLVKGVFKTAWSKGMEALLPGSPQAPASEKGEKPATPEEMESWLLERIGVTAEELRNLAADRAARVREYILATEKVEAERIFLSEKAPENDSGGSRAYVTLD